MLRTRTLMQLSTNDGGIHLVCYTHKQPTMRMRGGRRCMATAACSCPRLQLPQHLGQRLGLLIVLLPALLMEQEQGQGQG